MSDSTIVLSDIVEVYFSPMNTKRESEIERQIEKLKRELAGLGQLRPGSLSKQYTLCGHPGCRCVATPPQKHGPYYQLRQCKEIKVAMLDYWTRCGLMT
jgi:hypothetical protein